MSPPTRARVAAVHNDAVILVMHPSDELYGADRVLLAVVDRMLQQQQVVVWLPTDVDYPGRRLSRELEAIGVVSEHVALPVLRRAYANPRDVAAVTARALHLGPALRALRPTEVYVNTSALAPAVRVSSALGIPTTLHIHETWGAFERRVLTPMCTPADVVVTVGSATRSALPEMLRRRAVVRRHSVIARPEDPARSREIRRGIGSSGPVVLYAGRWTPGKGIGQLLAALRGTGAHLLLLGGPPPSGEGVDVLEAIESEGVSSQVHVVGEVDDVWPYIYACDAVAVPSVHPESYPTIALEARAAGRPVLASDIGGLPEIVTPGRGWLVPPGDIPTLSKRLAALPMLADLQQ
jgi:glycosyltransferase involved in cell wall biosynthesis